MNIQEEPGIAIFPIAKRFDSSTSPDVETALNRLIAGGTKKIICDFSGTEYVASAGMRVLLTTAKSLSKTGGKMVFCSLAPPVRKVFEIAGFTQIFPIFESCDSALKKLG
ncbi:MAG: STAS domain-containing protein [Methanoregulaceae archaeon]|nr:STAS domain-containing protein [Methanoregulaceae archaeon]